MVLLKGKNQGYGLVSVVEYYVELRRFSTTPRKEKSVRGGVQLDQETVNKNVAGCRIVHQRKARGQKSEEKQCRVTPRSNHPPLIHGMKLFARRTEDQKREGERQIDK